MGTVEALGVGAPLTAVGGDLEQVLPLWAWVLPPIDIFSPKFASWDSFHSKHSFFREMMGMGDAL